MSASFTFPLNGLLLVTCLNRVFGDIGVAAWMINHQNFFFYYFNCRVNTNHKRTSYLLILFISLSSLLSLFLFSLSHSHPPTHIDGSCNTCANTCAFNSDLAGKNVSGQVRAQLGFGGKTIFYGWRGDVTYRPCIVILTALYKRHLSLMKRPVSPRRQWRRPSHRTVWGRSTSWLAGAWKKKTFVSMLIFSIFGICNSEIVMTYMYSPHPPHPPTPKKKKKKKRKKKPTKQKNTKTSFSWFFLSLAGYGIASNGKFVKMAYKLKFSLHTSYSSFECASLCSCADTLFLDQIKTYLLTFSDHSCYTLAGNVVGQDCLGIELVLGGSKT